MVFQLLKNTLSANSEINIHLKNKFIFLCGGTDKDTSNRYSLKAYMEKQHRGKHAFLIAEDIKDFVKSTGDFLELENAIGDYSDLIIIILESPGAIAELGAFANNKNLEKKILVVNKEEFKDTNSFINDGPIKSLIRKSEYKDVIYYKTDNAFLNEAEHIYNNIENNIPTYGRNLSITELNSAHTKRVAFIILLIQMLSPITREDAIYVINSSFNFKQTEVAISIINTLQYFDTAIFNGVEYFLPKNEALCFASFDDYNKLRQNILFIYKKYNPALFRWYQNLMINEVSK